jgi:hypothetical protein
MRLTRSLSLFAAGMALALVASSANAAYYTFVGRLTTNRGRASNVPMAGTQNCGSLTILTAGFATHTMKVARGVNTQPGKGVALTNAFNWKTKTGGGAFKNLDQGCVKAVLPLKTTGGGAGVGMGFSLPPKAFRLPYPHVRHPAFYMFKTDIPVVEVKNFAPAVQLATSVSITAAPKVRVHYGGTQGTKMGGTAMAAAFRQFKAGAFATQTGRAGGAFNWCPPPLSMLGSPGVTGCLGTGSGGFPALISYTGGGSAFGGTMSMVTHQVAGVGSMALFLGGPFAFNNFGGGESLGTGRGYADYNHIKLSSGDIHKSGTIMTRYIGPVLKSQKVIGMVAATKVGMWPGGDVYDWGFPWTTMTVKIKAHNVANTRMTTFTAKGWDCAGNKEGPACSRVPTRGAVATGVNRNISLVSGSIGIARLPAPFGDAPIANMGNMQLLVMPEPGETLQMLAGVGALLAVAAWRSRRVR